MTPSTSPFFASAPSPYSHTWTIARPASEVWAELTGDNPLHVLHHENQRSAVPRLRRGLRHRARRRRPLPLHLDDRAGADGAGETRRAGQQTALRAVLRRHGESLRRNLTRSSVSSGCTECRSWASEEFSVPSRAPSGPAACQQTEFSRAVRGRARSTAGSVARPDPRASHAVQRRSYGLSRSAIGTHPAAVARPARQNDPA